MIIADQRQRRIGWIVDVPNEEQDVGQIDCAIVVYIAEGNVTVVGQNNGGVRHNIQ